MSNPLSKVYWLFKPSVNGTMKVNSTHGLLLSRNKKSNRNKIARLSRRKSKKNLSSSANNEDEIRNNESSNDAIIRSRNGYAFIDYKNLEKNSWILLNPISYYMNKSNNNLSTSTFPSKITLSKYQIYEKILKNNQINSILVIKVRFLIFC